MPTLYKTDQRIDHYKIIRQLSPGISSHVYLAKDLETEQQVVLKFPIDDLVGGADSYKSYLREKEIGTFLAHPHIQQHLNQNEQRQTDYLVLEYLPGQTLRVFVHENGKILPVSQVFQILLPVCEALAYAHKYGVIHRDMKPENIIVMDTGESKIIDFGIALLTTRQSAVWRIFPVPLVGTPNYMAPELFWGRRGTVQSDIYAIGVIFYELLCGQIPFERKGEFTYMNPQMAYDPPSILSVNPDLSPALATVVMRTIRRDSEKRYAQMQELLDDLNHLDKVIPVEYTPDPPKTGGKYRQFIAIGLVTLFIFAFMIAFGFLSQFAHSSVH